MLSLMFIMFSILMVESLFSVTHPISLGMVLVLMSIMIGAILFKMLYSWFFYLLVLVFLGGVMVLIMYMSTLSANEKFSPFSPSISALLCGMLYVMGQSSQLSIYKLSDSSNVVTHMYEVKNASSLLFLMVYLLITLICVVKLVKFEDGPLIKRL